MDADTLRHIGDGPARIEDEGNGLILVLLGEVAACRHAMSSAAISGSLRPSVYKIGNGPVRARVDDLADRPPALHRCRQVVDSVLARPQSALPPLRPTGAVPPGR